MVARLDKKTALRCVARLVRPLVRFCLRYSVRFQDVQELIKIAFIDNAQSEAGTKVSISDLSAMSGLQRKDISRILALTNLEESLVISGRDLITKVLGYWQTHKDYVTSKGEPRVLGYSEGELSFLSLVRRVSRDMNPAAVLAELHRTGAIEETARGIRLLVGSFAPKRDVTGGLAVLESDSDDLLRTIEENLFSDSEISNLHARTEYDKVREENLSEVRAWLLREGHKFHQQAREYVSQFDQDINPKRDYRGKLVKVVLGAFSRTEGRKL